MWPGSCAIRVMRRGTGSGKFLGPLLRGDINVASICRKAESLAADDRELLRQIDAYSV